MSAIRVMIVDDHPVVRSGLAQMVNSASDMKVVAEAESTDEALKKVQNATLDVLLLDLGLPGGGGMEVLRQIAESPFRILVLSVQPEEMYGVRCIQAGASGFLGKEASPDLILNAIRTVSQGRLFLSDVLRNQLMDASEGLSVMDRLTGREIEVMRLLVQGRRNRDIARDLEISEKTVSEHKRRLMEKLHVVSISDLVVLAREEGLKMR